jgi:dihydroneopterin aldolase
VARIRREGLSLFGHHGATTTERKVGTRLDVDVVVDVETTRAENSDRLADTVSYDVLEAAVRQVVEEESYRLLEALAARIATVCVERFGVRSCAVRIHKRNLAWPTGGSVSVEVTRTAPSGESRPRRARKP